MKNLKILDYLIWLFILVTVVSAIYFYQVLPEQIATHWNVKGEVDGWGSKTLGAWLAPGIMVLMYLLFQYLPKFDPKKENYKEFAKEYKYLQILLISFFLIIHFVTNLYNLGYDISVGNIIMAAVGLLFVCIGFYLKNIKPNWFVGIRTPWTLSNDYVWKKTHWYGSRVFVVAGLLFFVAPLLPLAYQAYVIWIMLVLIFSIVFYSYVVFKNQGQNTPEKIEEKSEKEE